MTSYTIYFDTETGGIQSHHPTIQLAAVAVNDETQQHAATFERKISFKEEDCDPEALRMNHYNPAQWEHSLHSLAVASDFARWVKPYSTVEMMSKRTGKPYSVAKLAGYNALTFDLPRLKALFDGQFFPCAYMVRDVLQRTIFYFDEHSSSKPENMKLSTVCAFFGIEVDGAHDALADAKMAALLMARLRQ